MSRKRCSSSGHSSCIKQDDSIYGHSQHLFCVLLKNADTGAIKRHSIGVRDNGDIVNKPGVTAVRQRISVEKQGVVQWKVIVGPRHRSQSVLLLTGPVDGVSQTSVQCASTSGGLAIGVDKSGGIFSVEHCA